ncbi:MAG: hypothetical protein APF84_05150 [Gracilibacter sp. BRH_c7a]|nr:MAG: hypothetical protein APF84_05150 [Gracilibacter sp. BRH_c7a]
MKKVAVLSKISFFLGVLSLVYFFFLLSLPGNLSFGVVLTGLLCLAFMLSGFVLYYKKNHASLKGVWKVLEVGMIIFLCWLVSLFFVAFMLMNNAQPTKVDNPEYLMILGASLDGDQPGLTLEKRLLVGLTYLQEHPEIPVIVSGGKGTDETTSEAKAMSIFLKANGISANRIILEENSRSTSENFKYSAEILQQRGEIPPVKILIVTSNFHLFRASMIANRNGFISGNIPAPTPLNVLPANLLREYFALVNSFALDR